MTEEIKLKKEFSDARAAVSAAERHLKAAGTEGFAVRAAMEELKAAMRQRDNAQRALSAAQECAACRALETGRRGVAPHRTLKPRTEQHTVRPYGQRTYIQQGYACSTCGRHWWYSDDHDEGWSRDEPMLDKTRAQREARNEIERDEVRALFRNLL